METKHTNVGAGTGAQMAKDVVQAEHVAAGEIFTEWLNRRLSATPNATITADDGTRLVAVQLLPDGRIEVERGRDGATEYVAFEERHLDMLLPQLIER